VGDFMETGVWRGGTSIFMRALLKVYAVADKNVWVCDSFEGLPKPNEEKYAADKGDDHYKFKELAISIDQVKFNFKKYDLLDDQVKFLKGWFKDTMPVAPVNKLSLLRLDGDMYESTIDVLEYMYPKLSLGGYCLIDDYALAGCKLAVDEYRQKHNITSSINMVDWSGAYWKK
jgi:O-methyltransferase